MERCPKEIFAQVLSIALRIELVTTKKEYLQSGSGANPVQLAYVFQGLRYIVPQGH